MDVIYEKCVSRELVEPIPACVYSSRRFFNHRVRTAAEGRHLWQLPSLQGDAVDAALASRLVSESVEKEEGGACLHRLALRAREAFTGSGFGYCWHSLQLQCRQLFLYPFGSE